MALATTVQTALAVHVPLFEEYGSTVKDGLTVGLTIDVPEGMVAVIATKKGDLTDFLTPGSHAVGPERMPGLAAATRMGQNLGAKVPASVYLVRLAPITDIPLIVELTLTGGNSPGQKILRLTGKLGFQMTDPWQAIPALFQEAVRQAAAKKSNENKSFRLTTGAGNKKAALASVPTAVSDLILDSAQTILAARLQQQPLGPEHLAGAHEAIQLAAGTEMATRMAQVHLQLLQLQVDPVAAPKVAPCRQCGTEAAPVAEATFRRNIGLIRVRFATEVNGNFCVPCAVKKSLTDNGIMLVCGWWGLISAVIAPVYFVQNVVNLVHVVRKAKPEGEPKPPALP